MQRTIGIESNGVMLWPECCRIKGVDQHGVNDGCSDEGSSLALRGGSRACIVARCHSATQPAWCSC